MKDKQAKPGFEEMTRNSEAAAGYLKTLAHQGRLMILCHLVQEEMSVGALEEALGTRQAAVSQMLARLRDEGLVTTRREGKAVYYSLADDKTRRMIELLYELYCA